MNREESDGYLYKLFVIYLKIPTIFRIIRSSCSSFSSFSLLSFFFLLEEPVEPFQLFPNLLPPIFSLCPSKSSLDFSSSSPHLNYLALICDFRNLIEFLRGIKSARISIVVLKLREFITCIIFIIFLLVQKKGLDL